MMIDLWELAKKSSLTWSPEAPFPLPRYLPGMAPDMEEWDPLFFFSAFEFPSPPDIIFIDQAEGLRPVRLFADIPELPLTVFEDQTRINYCSNRHFQDYPHLLVVNIFYDDQENRLYLQLVRTWNSVIVTYKAQQFAARSPIYSLRFAPLQASVNLVTEDGAMPLFARYLNTGYYGDYMPIAVNLRCFDEIADLSTPGILENAMVEEIDYALANDARTATPLFQYSRPEVRALSISLKPSREFLPSLQLIAHSALRCNAYYLWELVLNNMAEGAAEYGHGCRLLPLSADSRGTLMARLFRRNEASMDSMPGAHMHVPVVISATRFYNGGTASQIPARVPYSRGQIWPLTFFKSTPLMELAISPLVEAIDEEPVDLLAM